MRRSIIFFILAFFICPIFSSSQWSNDPLINNPVCRAAGDQQGTVIISDGSGGAIIAWQDKRSGVADIYAQRLNSAGGVQWAADGVAVCTAANSQTTPAIAADGSGGAIITWQDDRGDSLDIYAQHLNSAGVAQWATNGIALCTAVNAQNLPKIVADGDGGAVVTWDDERGADADIYAQKVSAGGALQWGTNGVVISALSESQQLPTLTSDGAGGAIIAWQDYRNGSTSDIFAQRVDSTGAARWLAHGLPICTAADQQYAPRLIPDGSGGAFIVWVDDRLEIDEDIYAQRVASGGALQWAGSGLPVCTAISNQRYPTLAEDGSGGVIIAWHDYRTSTKADIYAQRLDGAGSPQWGVDGVVVSAGASYQFYPQLVGNGKHGAIIAWSDQRAGQVDVYAQHLGGNGGARWNANGVGICTAAGNNGTPQPVSDGHGGAIVVWEDNRAGAYDIYAAKVELFDIQNPRHAAGDFDGDGVQEIAFDMGASGAWFWNGGTWSQITGENPESLMAAGVDGDAANELVIDLGASGLWLWDAGSTGLLSGSDPETLAAGDIDADGWEELVVDFGSIGLWLWKSGAWVQLSGADLDRMTIANLSGAAGAGIICDFSVLGLWSWSGGSWTQLSGVNADYAAAGNADLVAGQDLIGDFGAVGLWLYAGGSWIQLSGVNTDCFVTADADGNGDEEIAGDFGTTGLWLWDSGDWTQLSGVNAGSLLTANVDGDLPAELAVDFGALGLWLWNEGTWTLISGVNPDDIVSGDIDGDGAAEIFADFGSLGLWLWDAGSWTQSSSLNPD